MASAAAFAQTAPPPLSYQVLQQLQNNPTALNELLNQPAAPQAAPAPAGTISSASATGTWTAVTNLGGVSLSNPLLLTDGTVIVHNQQARDWWKLTPDVNGNYATGTWSKFAMLPSGYGPLYFGSEVLPDGRVVTNGGEYNLGVANDTNLGAIYYPSFGAWTSVTPPSFMANIGDSPSVVLDDGTYLLGDCCAFNPPQAGLFNATPPFTSVNWTLTGTDKANGSFNEEGWTVLPSGNVIAVDVAVYSGQTSEIYSPVTGDWSTGGATGAQLSTCITGVISACEMGPEVLRPDGTMVAFGGVNEGADPIAIYNSTASTWSAGPNVPSVAGVPYTLADAGAAIEPNGTVLFAASPSNWATSSSYPSPVQFFEISSTNVVSTTANTPNAGTDRSYYINLLVLPNGQIFQTDFSTQAQVYTPVGSANPAWAPVIDTSPTDVSRAYTYQLAGTQFNGLTHGAAYGDDVQANTNYPIVQIVNNSTGHVFYERTSGFNTMSVAPNTSSSTNFTVSGLTETGPSTLYVIANGISSTGVTVTVH
jgi:hypothetical protein